MSADETEPDAGDWSWLDEDDDDWDDDEEGDGADHADPRVQAGVEHLQRAAREVIAASRALLDVAEELVEDPSAVTTFAEAVAGLAGMAGRARIPGWPTGPIPTRGASTHEPGTDEGDEPDDPPVQRIPVS